MLHLPDEHTSEQHVCIVMFANLRKTVGTESCDHVLPSCVGICVLKSSAPW